MDRLGVDADGCCLAVIRRFQSCKAIRPGGYGNYAAPLPRQGIEDHDPLSVDFDMISKVFELSRQQRLDQRPSVLDVRFVFVPRRLATSIVGVHALGQQIVPSLAIDQSDNVLRCQSPGVLAVEQALLISRSNGVSRVGRVEAPVL